MRTLYLLAESDFDTFIYEAFAESLTSHSFSSVSRRMRKGSGIAAVQSSLKLAVQEIARMATESGVYFIIAMDNDRAPHAACSDALCEAERKKLTTIDQKKSDRYKTVLRVLEEILGPDPANWKVPLAVAVPVEMIESWLILITNTATASSLPRFSRDDDTSAIHFYRPAKPPPQLKDLCDEARRRLGYNAQDEWALDLVCTKMDAADLAARSHSFRIFRDWFATW